MTKPGLLTMLLVGSMVIAFPVMGQRTAETSAPAAAAPRVPKPTFGTFGFTIEGMDRSVAPGDDFLKYACGAYLKSLTIPPDRSAYGVLDVLTVLSESRTRGLVEAAAAKKDMVPGSEAQKIGDYYASFMDEATIEAKGLAPLKPQLDAIASIVNRSQLAKALGLATRRGIQVPVTLYAFGGGLDVYSLQVGQGGLGLPDRSYYLDLKNPKLAEVRVKYSAHIAAMLRLIGFDNPDARSKDILDLETKIAEVQWPREVLRQIDKLRNPVKFVDLEKTYPGLDWAELAAAVGVQGQKEWNILAPSAIVGTVKLLADASLETWKDYLAFHTLKAASPYLPKAVVKENFAFEGSVLAGRTEQSPRWKRGVYTTTEALGEAIGKLYVSNFYPPEAKHQADLMIKNILAAMDQRLVNLTWMDPWTKTRARSKLASLSSKIGYPSKWRDYSGLEVRRGDALGNALRAEEFSFQRNLDKLDKLPDPREWSMTPMTVNAYANSSLNEIVFPAAILQPPLFDPNADSAVNYGGIGTLIGHEISHHFDDRGRKVDEAGFFLNWWTVDDLKRYRDFSERVVKQYSAYEPLPSVHINGRLTLSENIADLAGLNIALEAYHLSLDGKPAEVLGGFTGDQRFFLAFAQSQCAKYRDQALLRQLATDTHTPSHLRPNAVRNLDAWYEAFGVKPGQTLYLAPEDRIKFW